MSTHESLGAAISRLRLAAGLSISELAEQVGMRAPYLASIEEGREEPSARALSRLAERLEPAGARYDELARLLTAPELDFFGERETSAGDGRARADARIESASDQAGLESLALDEAQFEEPNRRTCAMCTKTLDASYFQLNGRLICATCCAAVQKRLNAGGGAARGLRATLAGLGAAAAGTIVYYGVLAVTGYSLALITILIGYMVGRSVRWGSYGRGGWRYQALAMVLTYLSIVTSYVPVIVKAIAKQPPRSTTAQSLVIQGNGRPPAPRRPPSAGTAFIALVALIVISATVPFMMVLRDPLQLLIIGIGVYEAWKLNRRRVVAITGPHSLGAPVAQPSL